MKANETALIANSQKRLLTAKGYKFLTKLQTVACEQRGLTIYHKQMRDVKSQIEKLVLDLIIDKRMSEIQIREIVKNSVSNKLQINQAV